MRERPGRVLPSVIAGGLLISGLALGAGTAGAADTCKIETDSYEIVLPLLYSASGGKCTNAAGVITKFDAETMGVGLKLVVPTAADPSETSVAPTTTTVAPTTTPKATPSPGGNKGGGASNGGGQALAGAPAGGLVAPPAAGGLPAAVPAPLAAAGPVGALPPLLAAAPAGLATNLFSANSYDPGLLIGSPLGDAAAALFTPQADSAVTTVSQAQALAAPEGSGYGTPATIGVIILACLIGFAVRHRVITRMKNREVPADHRPRHAAPEPEDAEPATELQPAPDEARTLVVLTRR